MSFALNEKSKPMDFIPMHGYAVMLKPNIARVTAKNINAFTYQGTNSYIIGQDCLAIIDPGPDDDSHFETLLKTINNRPVSHIFVTHSHKDHSSLAPRLAQYFNAKIVAEGPTRYNRPPFPEELLPLDAGSDMDFSPDITLTDGEIIKSDVLEGGWCLKGITTPGHMTNHMVFALLTPNNEETGIVFTGDHVMAWATTVIAPPEGNMHDYFNSLNKLLLRDDLIYYPGHGGPINKPRAFVRGLKAHRKMRERAILQQIQNGNHTIADIVTLIYRDLDMKLQRAAQLSVFAHLEDLVQRKCVETTGTPRFNGIYTISHVSI